MSWQDRLRTLGERLASGEITTTEYRARSEEILAEADREAAAATQPQSEEVVGPAKGKVHIPKSAAWEAPSGEMTQIVGTEDRTRVVNNSITDKLIDPGDRAD